MKKSLMCTRRMLSIVLCMAMLTGTFCFFDIGSVIADAMVSTGSHELNEASDSSSAFSTYSIKFPEIIYMKPGRRTSEYFLNEGDADGEIMIPTSETGDFSFSCGTATEVKVKARLYDSNLNNTVSNNYITDISLANGAGMSGSGPEGTTFYSVSSSSFATVIDSISLAENIPGQQYIIEWTIQYKVMGRTDIYTTCVFTGVRCPVLSQAGLVQYQHYDGTFTSHVDQTSYAFITGVDSVDGGNASSAFTTASSTILPSSRIAPLVEFSGSANGTSNYTMPVGQNVITDNNYFPLADNGGVFRCNDSESRSKIWGTGADDTYTPAKFGGTTYGNANITIDISRYKDMKDIPNLSCGYAQFYHHWEGAGNSLYNIRNCTYTSSDAAWYWRDHRCQDRNTSDAIGTAATWYCAVDRTSEGSTNDNRSWVRGPYPIIGRVPSSNGHTYMRFEYCNGYDPAIGSRELNAHVATVRLSYKVVDKRSLRQSYYQHLNSGVNDKANNWSTYIGYVKAIARQLCVPTNTTTSHTNLTSSINSAQSYLKTIMTAAVAPPTYFYVPEVVYLAPVSSSWQSATSSKFQWFVDNDVVSGADLRSAPVTKPAKSASSSIYFQYANASSVNISYRLLSSVTSNTSISGGSMYVGGSTLAANTGRSMTKASGKNYFTIALSNESVSPNLGSATTGYFIEWTASYRDSLDNYNKTITAYTYVYKPYTVPVGTAIRTVGEKSWHSDFFCSSIAWLTGFHSATQDGGGKFGKYTTSNNSKGIAGFLSDDNYGNNAVQGTMSQPYITNNPGGYQYWSPNASRMYAVFATTSSSTSYFYAGQSGSGIGNNGSADWISDSQGATYNIRNFSYSSHDHHEDNLSNQLHGGAKGNIYIDTSRYTDLSQIPNLGCGLMITDREHSDNGSWYVADHTDSYNTGNGFSYETKCWEGGGDKHSVFNLGTRFAGQGDIDHRNGNYISVGIKYAGAWPRAIINPTSLSSSETYHFKALNASYRDKNRHALSSHIIDLNATQFNKKNLRNAVARAQRNFGVFGIYNAYSMSSYFYSGSTYNNFVNTYRNACQVLTKLDANPTNMETLATNLHTYINSLLNGTDLKTGTAKQINIGLKRNASGTYSAVSVQHSSVITKNYTARDNIYFTPENYDGFTFIGCVKPQSDVNINTLMGKTTNAYPQFMSGSDFRDSSASVTDAGAWFPKTGTESVTKPVIEGNANGNITYRYVSDTSYYFVYFYIVDQYVTSFDLNYDGIKVNRFSIQNYRSSNQGFSPFTEKTTAGVTASYNPADGTVKLNGRNTASTSAYLYSNADFEANQPYTYKVYYAGGSKTIPSGKNLTITFDAYTTGLSASSGRLWRDHTPNQADWVSGFTPNEAQAQNYKVIGAWSWVSDSADTYNFAFNNYQFRIELVEGASPNSVFSPNSRVLNYGDTMGTMPVPEREGYTFSGWYTKPSGGEIVTADDLQTAGDRTLYAHWEQIIYDVMLDNEFDYEAWSDTLTHMSAGSYVTNKVNNSITTISPAGASTGDNYTIPYSGGDCYKMHLEPGQKYTLHFKYSVPKAATLQAFVFYYPSASSGGYTGMSSTYPAVPAVQSGEKGGMAALTFTVPSDAPYVSMRLGTAGAVNVAAVFWDITVQRTYIYEKWNNIYQFNDDHILGGIIPAETGYVNNQTERWETIEDHYQRIAYGDAITDMYVPEREGFVFLGWWRDDGDGNRENDVQYTGPDGMALSGRPVCKTDGIKLYSRWTPDDFLLYYHANKPANATSDVTGMPSSPQTLYYGHPFTLSGQRPSLRGWTFREWTDNSDGSGTSYNPGQSITSCYPVIRDFYLNAPKRIYAQWTANKITVNFNGNGHTGGSVSSQIFTYDTSQALNANRFTKSYTVTYNGNVTGATPLNAPIPASAVSDYTFSKWNNRQDGTGSYSYTDRQNVKNPNGAESGQTTLYAQWSGGNITLPGPSRKGYDFDGWYTAASGGTRVGGAGSSYSPQSDITLYAHWSARTDTPYKVQVYLMNTSGEYLSIPAVYNRTGRTDTNITISASEYYPDSSGQFSLDTGRSNVLSGNIDGDGSSIFTVYIKRASHKVNYNASRNGGTTTAVQATVYYMGTINLNPTASKKNWTFAGWNTDPDATAKITSKTMGTEDVTLYAIFSAQPEAVFHYLDGITPKTVTVNGTKIYNNTNRSSYAIPSISARATVNSLVWTMKGFTSATAYNGTQGTSLSGTFTVNNPDNSTTNHYYMCYEATVTVTHNADGGTLTGSNPTAKTYMNAYSAASQTAAGLRLQTPAKREGYVFLGWADTPGASEAQYSAEQVLNLKTNKTVYAVWYSTEAAQEISDDFINYVQTDVAVLSGINVTDNSLNSTPVYDGRVFRYVESEYNAYKSAYDNYQRARTAFGNSQTTENNESLISAVMILENIVYPRYNDIIDDYYINNGNFRISYSDSVSNRPVPEGVYSLRDMNLNHYQYTTLNKAKDALINGANYRNAFYQTNLNSVVETMAKSFVSKANVKTAKPEYMVYETKAAVRNSGLISNTSGISGVNYVYSGKDNVTYYCYANTVNPTMLITVDDVAEGGRLCYPTKTSRLDTAVTGGSRAAFDKLKTDVVNNQYNAYTSKDIGTSLGRNYYSEKQLIKLTPEFTSDRGTVKYTISSHDDSYRVNYAETAELKDGINGKIPVATEDTSVTPPQTVTIIIDYHPGDSFDAVGAQVQQDRWLKQFHILRTSGGANNWEFPNINDTVYTLDDGFYGQTGYGSFMYTYKLGSTNDFRSCTLNSTDVNTVRNTVKNNFAAIKSVEFRGTVSGGNGLGFMQWPQSNGWNVNYYPKSQSYTYVHLADRWGNTVDKVIYVGNIDSIAAEAMSIADGELVVIEDGGSGINTMTIDKPYFRIAVDENSSYNNGVYNTTGNTLRIYTGEPQQAYSLTAEDCAENLTEFTARTDKDGYLTITVDDLEYDKESGKPYTFTLNGTEINLYSKVEKYIIKADDVLTEAGKLTDILVITKGEVTKLQLTDADGTNTYTDEEAEVTENPDGTKTWRVRKIFDAGEHSFGIKVKSGISWIDENRQLTVTAQKPVIFTGRVVSVDNSERDSHRYFVKAEGRPDKIQLTDEHGNTWTYTRYHEKVHVTSYNADGETLGTMSRELDYEIWEINSVLIADSPMTARAKYSYIWNTADEAYAFMG